MDILQIYRGKDYTIGNIECHSPILDEVCEYGERNFFTVASLMCAIPTDYMSELDEQGIRYEELDDYMFFITSLFQSLTDEDVKIFYPNMRPSKMDLYQDNATKEIFRKDAETGVRLDKSTYLEMVETLRTIFGFKAQPKIPGDELTRQKMIQYDKLKKNRAKRKPTNNESTLFPLVSAMVNCGDFKYDHETVWKMPFFAFMDSVRRVSVVRAANQISTGGYFGVNLSECKKYLDWMRPL